MVSVKCLGCGRTMPEKTAAVARAFGERRGAGHMVFCSKVCNERYCLDQAERDLERRAKEIIRKIDEAKKIV